MRAGDAVRVGLEETPLWFVRRGIPSAPHSRKWITVRDEAGHERHVGLDTTYIHSHEWLEWLRVYRESPTKDMLTCKCCGQTDWKRANSEEYRVASVEHGKRLREARNAAVMASGRMP